MHTGRRTTELRRAPRFPVEAVGHLRTASADSVRPVSIVDVSRSGLSIGGGPAPIDGVPTREDHIALSLPLEGGDRVFVGRLVWIRPAGNPADGWTAGVRLDLSAVDEDARAAYERFTESAGRSRCARCGSRLDNSAHDAVTELDLHEGPNECVDALRTRLLSTRLRHETVRENAAAYVSRWRRGEDLGDWDAVEDLIALAEALDAVDDDPL
jgi:hypothetical protein